MKILSVVIPAYNEERFIGTLLEKIKAVDLAPLGLTMELIVSTTARRIAPRRSSKWCLACG